MRASERLRDPERRILDDPYAHLFLGPVARATLASLEATEPLSRLADRFRPGLATFVVCRHRWIDDRLRAALRREVAQVLLLGAGYDTRAYRFSEELRGRPVFEVDFPATSRRKAKILAREARRLPRADVRRVEIDFEKDSLSDRLALAGFRRGAGTFVVWEGVTMYLTRETVKATLSTLHDLVGRGSEAAMDFWYLIDSPGILATAHRAGANLLALFGEPVTFGIHPEDVGPFLRRLRWREVDLADAAALEERYVRDRRSVQPGVYMVAARAAPHRFDRRSVP
jgi:methyltransferase (TIGR00027 family)